MNLSYPSFWKNASSKRKRIYLIILFFIVAVVVTLAGALVPLSQSESQQLVNSVNQTTNQPAVPPAVNIFTHNLPLCLAMFIPLFGAVFGLFVMFSTGIALGAELRVETSPGFQTTSTPAVSAQTAILALVAIAAVFTLEYVSYSTGMSESIWLFRRITQRRWQHEIKNLLILIGIVVALLAIGAIVETLTIKAGF
jgi:hypothetical protein